MKVGQIRHRAKPGDRHQSQIGRSRVHIRGLPRCGDGDFAFRIRQARGTSGQGAYAASKAGLTGLMKTAAREWGPHNIRVNLACPGWQQTGMAGDVFPSAQQLCDHMLGRASNLDEVARTICHLAQLSDVSGQIWNLDSRIL